MPCGREAAKMIQADRVNVPQHGAHSVDPPEMVPRAQRVPVVDRIAPQLPLCAEVVRRHAGDDLRAVLRIEQEQLRVGPHVARLGRDEEREIAEQAHAGPACVSVQTLCLAEPQELREPDALDLACEIAPRGFERGGHAPDERFRPLQVARTRVSGLQCPEKCVVVQPVRVFEPELLERGPQIRSAANAEVLPGGVDQA